MKRLAIALSLQIAVGLILKCDHPSSRADDGPGDEAARATRMTADEAKLWSIRVDDDASHSSVAGKDPNLRYTNPGVGRVYGNVYLFVADGRPAAVMSIFKWFTPWTGFEAEIQSLSTSPLKGYRAGQLVWEPARPGIEWHDVPDGPAPAALAVARLGQMRSIADGFAGRLVDRRVASMGEDQVLRLLPRPFYRYEPRDLPIRDGGLFAFVLGTDPEVFLLLETKETPRGPRWQYGLARMNSDPVQVTFRGQEVWRVEKVGDRYDPRGSYFSKELPQGSVVP